MVSWWRNLSYPTLFLPIIVLSSVLSYRSRVIPSTTRYFKMLLAFFQPFFSENMFLFQPVSSLPPLLLQQLFGSSSRHSEDSRDTLLSSGRLSNYHLHFCIISLFSAGPGIGELSPADQSWNGKAFAEAVMHIVCIFILHI